MDKNFKIKKPLTISDGERKAFIGESTSGETEEEARIISAVLSDQEGTSDDNNVGQLGPKRVRQYGKGKTGETGV